MGADRVDTCNPRVVSAYDVAGGNRKPVLAAYIVCLVIGGVLVLLGAFTGHADHSFGDHDGDFSTDHDGDVDHADTWIPFFSLRFWTYFLAGFGLTGLLLEKVANVTSPTSTIIAASTGFIAGLAVSYVLRLAMKSEADSSTKTHDLLGSTGKVVVAIRPGLPGKIRCQIKGEWVEMLALPEQGQTIEADEEVVVLTVENDRAHVVSKASLLD